MDAWKRIVSSLFLLAGGVASVQAQVGSPSPDVDTILARMAQARAENRTHLRPYSVIRDYKLFGKEKQTAEANIIADVSFVPPDVKHYAIRQANGMRLAEKIVRQMLDHETEIVKDYGSTDLTSANYDFRFVREEQLDGQRLLRIGDASQAQREDPAPRSHLGGRNHVPASPNRG